MSLTLRQTEPRVLRICLITLILCSASGVSAVAQETAESSPQVASGQCSWDPENPRPLSLGRKFAGIDRECLLCHSSGNPGGYSGPLTLTEAKTWKERDPHSWAYAVLLSEESQKIGARLGNPKNIHRDARCLACHSGFPLHNVKLEDGLVPQSLVEDPHNRLAWGVSCEACHGASHDGMIDGQQLRGWLEYHRKADWAKTSPEKKQTEFGYYDVRSPLAKARMCVSCHVGNADEGRVVTHEMYAAGHPPLPNFEIETFLSQMPPHWKIQSNDQAEKKPADKAVGRLQNMAIGAAVTWAEHLRLTAALCESEVALPAEKTGWPELAQFECYACHHELRQSGWRADRTLAVRPGRPLLRGAPSPILRAFLAVSNGDQKELENQERKVLAAFSQRPFGLKAAELSPILNSAADWADQWAENLEKLDKPIDGRKLMLEVSFIAAEDVYEYDTARQIMWAFQSAWDPADTGSLPEEVGESFAAIQEMFLAQLADARTNPGTDVILNLNREIRFINLAEVFPPIANYDAAKFREQFAKIHKQLNSGAKQP